jgi:sirohydrochlorin cobaltochelatase
MMKKRMSMFTTVLLVIYGLGIMTGGLGIYAKETSTVKKAILVVSFGSTYADTRKATIEAVEARIRAAFPDYEVRSAFTSRIIIKKLAERDGLKYDTESQALEKLKTEGYTEVLVQPLHIEAGDEYVKIIKAVSNYASAFAKIAVGRPLLYYTGQANEKPDDYRIAIQALRGQLPNLGAREAVGLMGHGGLNPANTAYAALQLKLEDAGLKNVFVFTVEGYPTLDNLIVKLQQNKIKKVTLIPFMMVAGDHANNDMAGDEEDSFKSQLQKAGFQVEVYLHGLGENTAVQNIYVQHVKDMMFSLE